MSHSHVIPSSGAVHPCLANSHGYCAVCERITPGNERYSAAYHRLFDPSTAPEEEPREEEVAPTPPGVDPAPAASPVIPPETSIGGFPLAGDLVAGLTEALGVDKAAEWIAKQLTGVPNCGCASRREALNRLDAKARRLLGRLRGGVPARPIGDVPNP